MSGSSTAEPSLSSLHASLDAVVAQLHRQDAENAELRRYVGGLDAKVGRLEAECGRLEAECGRLEGENRELRAAVKRHADDLQTIGSYRHTIRKEDLARRKHRADARFKLLLGGVSAFVFVVVGACVVCLWPADAELTSAVLLTIAAAVVSGVTGIVGVVSAGLAEAAKADAHGPWQDSLAGSIENLVSGIAQGPKDD